MQDAQHGPRTRDRGGLKRAHVKREKPPSAGLQLLEPSGFSFSARTAVRYIRRKFVIAVLDDDVARARKSRVGPSTRAPRQYSLEYSCTPSPTGLQL